MKDVLDFLAIPMLVITGFALLLISTNCEENAKLKIFVECIEITKEVEKCSDALNLDVSTIKISGEIDTKQKLEGEK